MPGIKVPGIWIPDKDLSTIQMVSLFGRFVWKASFFVRCLELQKKSQTGKSTKVDPETGKATKRAKCESGCSFRKAQNVAAVRDQALLQVQVKQYRVEICQA